MESNIARKGFKILEGSRRLDKVPEHRIWNLARSKYDKHVGTIQACVANISHPIVLPGETGLIQSLGLGVWGKATSPVSDGSAVRYPRSRSRV